ncbi:fumarylacetoacetate hydrolase family protein [Paenibacillus hamazuiensis]|uniref:fumarylacetoacetate hydrolase family protein n=1 Tax=Paenibacillus hamazuiensis TaxID=2936508 RepID=UPI00200CEF5B|nr:fumarylacetoacetate hydrolase family protein [Paenibacillus hamazuiensis]
MTLKSIGNVYCVVRNYSLHTAESGNAVPESPMVFLKPTYSVVDMGEGEIGLPGDQGEVHYEAELVLRISRTYRPGLPVDELVDAMTLGIDFTLREVQTKMKLKGYPWLPAKGFLNSAPIGKWRPFPGAEAVATGEFILYRNGEIAQLGRPSDMIFELQKLIDFIGTRFGLGEGDIIFTGTPSGAAAIADGDLFELFWGEEPIGKFRSTLRPTL